MKKNAGIKAEIYAALQDKLDEKIIRLQATIASIEESRNNETKSSVGDKYETGRAMMQHEIAQANRQLHQVSQQKRFLDSIDIEKAYSIVESGACVQLDSGIYFISIGIGKLQVTAQTVYVISLDAPLGKLLHRKQAGDSLHFQGRTQRLLEVW